MGLRGLIQHAVSEAVHKSTPPVGVLLSGGIDSSTVAAFAGELPTFTGYYDIPGFDERGFAKLAVNGPHHCVEITPQDFVDQFDAMVQVIDPFGVGPGVLGQWCVAKYASQLVNTLLSGEGGDELFGGYARLLKVAGQALPPGYENMQLPKGYPDMIEAALAWDLMRLPVLMAADEQICAAWHITVKAPLTDRAIVDYALHLSAEKRIGKTELKNVMRGVVPDMILDRKSKMGLPTQYVLWAQEEPVKSFVEERIGYVPDVDNPYARDWWYELCRVSK